MAGDTIEIRYQLSLPDGASETFEVRLDPGSVALLREPGAEAGDAPDWTRLDYHQCPNCPLQADAHPRCPAAAALVDVVRGVERVYAHEAVHVRVETAERAIEAETTVQRSVGSLMGLIMATSGCPHLSFFRPMARFHLPFASPDETIFRATGAFLLAEYLRKLDGESVDFDLNGLADVYYEVQTVNQAFAERLREASRADGAVNSLVALDVLAQIMPMAIEDQLLEIRYLFEPWLQARQGGDSTGD